MSKELENHNHNQEKEPDAVQAFNSLTCYDLLSPSYKVVVFETSLLLKKALAGLIQHGIQAAPLWDSKQQVFAGLLTVTDFIHLIIYYYNNSSYEQALQEIEQLRISSLRRLQHQRGILRHDIITVDPMENLLTASRLLIKNRLHRLPLIDRTDGVENIISVITQYKILKYIAQNAPDITQSQKTLRQLGTGTFNNLATAKLDTPLIDVLNTFISSQVSCVPVVDDNYNLVEAYEKYDVLMLAKDGVHYDLEMPVSEALLKRSPNFEGVHTCTLDDTLGNLLKTIKRMPVHRFIVVEKSDDLDEKDTKINDSPTNDKSMYIRRKKLLGIVSLSDLLKCLIDY